MAPPVFCVRRVEWPGAYGLAKGVLPDFTAKRAAALCENPERLALLALPYPA